MRTYCRRVKKFCFAEFAIIFWIVFVSFNLVVFLGSHILELHREAKRQYEIVRLLSAPQQTVSDEIRRFDVVDEIIKLPVGQNFTVSKKNIARETGINSESARRIVRNRT